MAVSKFRPFTGVRRPTMRAAALATVLIACFAAASGSGDKPKNDHKPRDLSKGNTMYVVPYAHLDTQWRWAYPQVIREFIANTLHRNFDLFEKYPNYVFNFSGSRRYEMMKEYYPADYEKLKGYIKSGRWFPCGSSVDENDANVPSAESLVRQVLYGNHYFRREFGTASDEYMLPDCFGFPYALPSVLLHCGIKGFSTQKLTWNSANGIPFKVGTWEGPDGKSIVAALDPGSYGGQVDEDLSQNTSWLARIQNTGKLSGAYVDYHYYGTGDTGGAPRPGSVEWVEKSINGDGPITVVSSHADEMFNSLTPQQIAKLPHYKGELLLVEHSAGSISSEAMMKRWNRKNEQLAQGAEEASVAANWLRAIPYPSGRIYHAWDLVLGSQMHDMLPGTSIPKAYEFCWNDELLAQNQFAAVEQDALGAISSVMDTRGQGIPLVVYNPLSIPREDVVEAILPGFVGYASVTGPTGQAVPTQVVSQDSAGTHILFLAKVPASGFATFHVDRTYSQVVDPTAPHHNVELAGNAKMEFSFNPIENDRFRVGLDTQGDIASIYDKVNKREVLKAPIRLAFQYENPRQFPAWNMDWDDQQKPPMGYVDGPATIKLLEDGPVRKTVEVTRVSRGSKFVQDIRLTAGSDKVEVINKIDWQTKECALKASIPLANGNPKAMYDLQLGAIERGNNNPKQYEVPSHQWFNVDKTDGSYGVGILSESKYGSDKPDDNTVRLTMIYTPGVRGGYADQATQDFGRHEIAFAIAPHVGDWRKGDVAWKAKRFNQPLRSFIVPKHAGKMGKSFSLFSTNSKQVEISAIKKAEDSNEVVIRLRELSGAPAHNVQISSALKIVSARQVDGQERQLGAASVKNGTLITDVPSFSLKAFALKVKGPLNSVASATSGPISLPFDTDVASTDKKPDDGAFDARGRAIAAEQLPSNLWVDGIHFKFGPTTDGAKNAISAKGQTIPLGTGYDKVYILAASSSGDRIGQFTLSGAGSAHQYATTIQDWSGYVGQWDNRLWAGDPGPNFTNYGEMVGLAPGYVKKSEVAWFASHNHTPAGNTFYEYSYLYKYGFEIPKGATTLKLPNDPAIKILAISLARNTYDSARAAAPLSDTLQDHVAGGSPSISPSGGSFNNATSVTITPPLYWHGGGLHYTLDGSIPSASSPVYNGPFMVNDPVTIKAAEIDSNGKLGMMTSATLNVSDTTPPSVTAVSSLKAMGLARVKFSENVTRETAENPGSYSFSSGVAVKSAKLAPDGKSVDLTLAGPLPVGSSERLSVTGIKDLSKRGNAMSQTAFDVAERGAVLTQATFEPKTSKSLQAENLPVKARDTWTLNFFCKIDQQPEDRVLIAGFGRSVDGRTGTGRYFAKFSRGINFWAANDDVMTNVPLDTGKWQMLTATYDGTTMRLYKNGEQIAEQEVALEDDVSQARVMPLDAWERQRRFGGEIRDFTIWDQDLPPAVIKQLWETGKG